jgi:hypothetical protein
MATRKAKTTETTPASPPLSQEELLRRWEARVKKGTFSPAVKGLGTVRVMGRAGDAPVRYPRIETLAALETLEPDERAAVQYAEEVVQAHQRAGRSIVAPTGGAGTALPGSQKVRQFDPTCPDVIILSRIVGG